MSEEASRPPALDATTVASAAARREDGGKGDWEGGEKRRERRSSTMGEIALPCLTRLDLNNNILHNLDDLKVRTEPHPAEPRMQVLDDTDIGSAFLLIAVQIALGLSVLLVSFI